MTTFDGNDTLLLMKSLPAFLSLALFVLTGFSAPMRAELAPELREAGVLYFDDALAKNLTVPVTQTTLIYQGRDFSAAAGSLYSGQPLTLIGVAPEGYYVQCLYRGSTLQGWIKTEDLPPGIDPRVIEDAKKEQKRRDAVALAIAGKKVIRGMLPAEVVLSLGQPEKVTTQSDAEGKRETWSYTTYREEVQNAYTVDALGRPILQPYYVKVPIGSVGVDFLNGVVVRTQEVRTLGSAQNTPPVYPTPVTITP